MATGIPQYIEERASDLVDLTCRLIERRTPNPPGDRYRELVLLAADWLQQRGLDVELILLGGDGGCPGLREGCHGERLALIAKCGSPAEGRRVCFQGHYDTVPPSSGWRTDPYRAEVTDGHIVGLGASDMKGGIAAMMMACAAVARSCGEFGGQVMLLLTPDEEYATDLGLKQVLQSEVIAADYAIVGEPSGVLEVHHGMKSAEWGDVILHGTSCHGSRPDDGANAFTALAAAARAISTKAADVLRVQSVPALFYPRNYNHSTIMLGGVVEGSNLSRAAVPDRCYVSYDVRLVPGVDRHDARKILVDAASEAIRHFPGVKIEVVPVAHMDGYCISEDSRVCAALSRAIQQTVHAAPRFSIACGAMETSMLSRAGMQAVAYGPGSWECAHSPNERVSIRNLVDCAKVYALAAAWLCSGHERELSTGRTGR